MSIKEESECKNLKLKNGEFCSMWRCRNLEKDYPCITCPVMNDLSMMANALHMSVDLYEDVAIKAV